MVCRIGTGPELFFLEGRASGVDVEAIAGRSGASMVQGVRAGSGSRRGDARAPRVSRRAARHGPGGYRSDRSAAVSLAQAQRLTARIQALAKRADNLRGRAGASLRGKHGFDFPELSESPAEDPESGVPRVPRAGCSGGRGATQFVEGDMSCFSPGAFAARRDALP
jgi:hypothetical protein